MDAHRRPQLLALVAVTVGLGWLLSGFTGCGSDESTFGADQFAGLIGEAGAPLDLAESLSSSDTSIEIRVIKLHGGGGGTMLVATDVGRARNEFTRCESAVSLVCFRAANVVLRFDEIDPAQLARVSEALQAIESASQSS